MLSFAKNEKILLEFQEIWQFQEFQQIFNLPYLSHF